MSFTIRCSTCGFGSLVPTTTIEWLCPKCGTKMHVVHRVMWVHVIHPPLIMSTEEIQELTDNISRYLQRLVGLKRILGTKVKIGG